MDFLFIIFVFLMLLGLIVLFLLVINNALYKKDVIKHLRFHKMQEELDNLEIGTGNIRGRLYAKRYKDFYETRTDDEILNSLKEKVCRKDALIKKLFIILIIFGASSGILMLILGLVIYGIA